MPDHSKICEHHCKMRAAIDVWARPSRLCFGLLQQHRSFWDHSCASVLRLANHPSSLPYRLTCACTCHQQWRLGQWCAHALSPTSLTMTVGTNTTSIRGFCVVQTFINQRLTASLDQNIAFMFTPPPPPPPPLSPPSPPPPPLPPNPPPSKLPCSTLAKPGDNRGA